jgi:predicted N-acetyltransferase YhbS
MRCGVSRQMISLEVPLKFITDVLCLDLASMAVHPDFQYQGIGRKLLAEVCSLADESSQDIYLESTPTGLKLYQNTGFESLGSIALFGGEYSWTWMLRKPKLAA